jgi:putative hydrolase of the HAD superfamily
MTATHALIDIGNVLLAFDFEPALKTLVPGTTPAEASRKVEKMLARKDDFESGRIGEDEFISWASAKLGFAGTPDEFRAAWNSIFVPVDDMWAVVRELRATGITLILFSNTNPIHAESFVNEFAIFAEFDHAVFSHEVGAIKPDARIYQYALETHGLNPQKTLYIDDLAENIAAGREFGLRCHQYDYRNHARLTDWLRRQG